MEIQIKNINTGEIETLTANENGEIILPKGEYLISGDLHIPANIKIIGFTD